MYQSNVNMQPGQNKWMVTCILFLIFLLMQCSANLNAVTGSGDDNDGIKSGKESSIRDAVLPILDRWFPEQSLNSHWESRPLVSSIYPNKMQGHQRLEDIEMVYNDDFNGVQEMTKNMFNIQNVDSVLSSPDVVLQENVKLLKKIVKEDGSEWNGMLPLDPSDPNVFQKMMGAFQHGAFSLVINSLERKWSNVAQMAYALQNELNPDYVSCNLYLTPPHKTDTAKNSASDSDSKTSGFESHWDWMDVFVVQISGQKLWTVANHPIDFMSTMDSKRKPTVEEVFNYASSRKKHSSYSDFLLRPGDMLYIPRGFMHNASTVGPHYHLRHTPLTPLEKDTMLDETALQNYFQQLTQQPSLHLTFGIEHKCHKIYEALFHYALRDFISSLSTQKTLGATSLKFPKDSCSGFEQRLHSSYKEDAPLLWESILHAAISYVARESNHTALRKSVPLTKALNEISQIQRIDAIDDYENNNDHVCNNHADTRTNCQALDPIMASFEESVMIFQTFTFNLQSTITFVSNLQKAENGNSFCLPDNSLSRSDVTALFECNLDAVNNDIKLFLENDKNSKKFDSLWKSFVQYISLDGNKEKILKSALTEMQKQNKLREEKVWNSNKHLLEKAV